MDSPFIFDKPVTGKAFVGRRSACSTLANIITHGQNAALWGPPKSGKRSAVAQTVFNLRSNGVPFMLCTLNLLNVRTPKVFIRKFAGEVIKAATDIPDEIESISEKYLYSTSLVFDRAFYAETGEVFGGTFKLSENDCLAALELPYLIARERNTGMAVVLEEFQNLDSPEGERLFKSMEDVMSAHRDTVSPFCSWILTGSRTNAMNSIFCRRHYFWNLVERVELPPFAENEIAEFVLKGFSQFGKVIDRDMIQGVCNLFKNNMWHINHFFFICNSLSKGFMNDTILNDALSCVMSVNESAYRSIMDDLTAFQERLLKAVLDGVVKFSTTDVIEKYALNSSANVKRLKDALMKKEVITFNDREEPEVIDPLFEYWLRKYYFKIGK